MNKKDIEKATKIFGSLGGKARAKKCSPEQLSEWGRKGAAKTNAAKKAKKIAETA